MRSLAFAAATWLVGSAAIAGTTPSDAAPAYPGAKTLLDSIAELDRSDPSSPAVLEGRLELVDLTLSAADGDCEKRLDEAQSQLDTAAADPSFEVLVPAALAREADLEYRIHTARASCGASQGRRADELHQGLAAAQRAVAAYSDALDYQSMAVMQFNIATTQRLLDNDTAAVAALRSVIDTDREFGFRDDAAENYKLLAQWTGKPNEPDPMQDFPARTTTLKFGWSICNSQVAVDVNYARVFEDRVLRFRGSTSFRRTYRQGRSNWQVAQEPGDVSFDAAEWPQNIGLLRDAAVVLERGLAEAADIDVDKQGNFVRARNVYALEERLSKASEALVLQHAPTQPHAGRLPAAVSEDIHLIFGSDALAERAAERYGLDTEVWIGATLEQGVWYKMSGSLALPGTIPISLSQDIEFAFTRQVPCKADSTERSCVELVVRATPQADAVSELLDAMRIRYRLKARYWSAIYMRIVTDPNTLLNYARDVRYYWHIGFDGAGPDAFDNEWERLVATSDY